MPMTDKDRVAFVEVFLALGEYYQRKLPEGVLELYFRGLKDSLAIEQVRDLAGRLIKTSEFFPKVTDFLEFIEGTPTDRAINAWSELVDKIERDGAYRSVMIADPMAAEALDRTFGGWIQACSTLPVREDPMFVAFEKQFIAHYQRAARMGIGESRRFMGICEADNRARGYLDQNGQLTVPGPPTLKELAPTNDKRIVDGLAGGMDKLDALIKTIKEKMNEPDGE